MILASGSPRRRELLDQIGVSYQVQPADIDETPGDNEPARDYVMRMALTKARAIAHRYPSQPVLGADTIGELHGQILVKPMDEADAARILSAMSGSTHQVMTAIALAQNMDGELKEQSLTVVTQVRFRTLSEDDIRAYIATQEPMDKAGAYGIQGMGAVLVDHIEGSYSNVVGLPLAETARLLKNFDVPIWSK